MMQNKLENRQTPHDKRRGALKNGNPGGDLSQAPRCGAKTRAGTACLCPAMANGRCRLHGGLSTGAKTEAGIARISAAVFKNGRHTKDAKAKQARQSDLAWLGRSTIAMARAMYRKPGRV
jgi:hypothetical protein